MSKRTSTAFPRYTVVMVDADSRVVAFASPDLGAPETAPRSFEAHGTIDMRAKAGAIIQKALHHPQRPARADLCLVVPAHEAMFLVPGSPVQRLPAQEVSP